MKTAEPYSMKMMIRQETREDIKAIYSLNEAAFGQRLAKYREEFNEAV